MFIDRRVCGCLFPVVSFLTDTDSIRLDVAAELRELDNLVSRQHVGIPLQNPQALLVHHSCFGILMFGFRLLVSEGLMQ